MTQDTPRLSTRVGHAGFGDARFFGHGVYAELAGHETFMGLAALAATGRRFDPDQCAVLDDIAAVMTVADPRIWPLKATRLGASYGNTIAGVAVGCLCMNSRFVGPAEVPPEAARMLIELAEAIAVAEASSSSAQGALEKALLERDHIPGFGVPGRAVDERLPALRDCLERRGSKHQQAFWHLFEQTAGMVREQRGLEPNISAGIAAAGLDLGLKPDELGLICTLIGLYLVLPNAFEGSRQQTAALQSLPDEFVRYVGPADRTSPRAEAPEESD